MSNIVAIQLQHLKKLLADRKINIDLDKAASRGWPMRATTVSMVRGR